MFVAQLRKNLCRDGGHIKVGHLRLCSYRRMNGLILLLPGIID